jgi:hypothetical protein
MQKILFTFVILLTLFFPKFEVLAQDVPEGATACDVTQSGSGLPAGVEFCDPAKGSRDKVTISGQCYCVDKTAAASQAPKDPCEAPGSCTSSKGQPCSDGTSNGIMTAIGCVPTEPRELVNDLLRYGIMAAGGIAFLLMLLGALQMITAEGNPESIKHGQERFYSAIIGLLLIIFSVLLMQVIGVDILGLPFGDVQTPPTRDPNS